MTKSKLNLLSKPVQDNEYLVKNVILLNAFVDPSKPNTLRLHFIPDTPKNKEHTESIATLSASEQSAWDAYSNAKATKKAKSTITKHENKALALRKQKDDLLYSHKSETYIDSDFTVYYKNIATIDQDEFIAISENAIYDLATCLSGHLDGSGIDSQDFRQAQLDKVRAFQENYNLTIRQVMRLLVEMANDLRGICVFKNTTIKKTWTGTSYAKITKPYNTRFGKRRGSSRSYYGGRTIK